MDKRLLITLRRCFWLLALLCCIFVPKIVYNFQPELDVVEYEVYSENYYSYSNQTSVSIEVTFNRTVSSGYVTISYYDESRNFLESKKHYLTAYGKTAKDFYELIKGKVDAYEITLFEFEASPYEVSPFAIIGICFSSFMLLAALSLSYKEREINGEKVSVYAGYYNHCIYINDIKCDDHNSFFILFGILLITLFVLALGAGGGKSKIRRNGALLVGAYAITRYNANKQYATGESKLLGNTTFKGQEGFYRKKTLVMWKPICLMGTMNSGALIEANISRLNRISIKANGSLL